MIEKLFRLIFLLVRAAMTLGGMVLFVFRTGVFLRNSITFARGHLQGVQAQDVHILNSTEFCHLLLNDARHRADLEQIRRLFPVAHERAQVLEWGRQIFAVSAVTIAILWNLDSSWNAIGAAMAIGLLTPWTLEKIRFWIRGN